MTAVTEKGDVTQEKHHQLHHVNTDRHTNCISSEHSQPESDDCGKGHSCNGETGEDEKGEKEEKEQQEVEEEETDLQDDLRCGYFCWKPDCIQTCNTPRTLLAAACWFAFSQGFVVIGINSVNTVSFERRFDLLTTQVAWISSCYDLSAGVCAIIFGYLGAFVHHGAMLTVGAYVMGLGSLTFLLPHALAGVYELGATSSELCDLSGNSTDECSEEASGDSKYLYVFMLGNILHGVGGSAVYTVGPLYMDNNVKTKNAPLYIGTLLACSAIGPAVGYIVGGFFLSLYVDIGRVDMDEITITPDDPRWVGAWWIGYVYSTVACFTVGLFTCCFPREFPVAKINRADRKSEAYKGKGDGSDENFGRSPRDVWQITKNVFSNPVFVLVTIGATVLSGIIIGISTFLPKVLQFQFSVSAAEAAMWSGIVVVPGAAGGQVIGGGLAKLLKLKLRGLIIESALATIAATVLSLIFLLRCDMPLIAGVTVPYNSSHTGEIDITSLCNEPCNCTTSAYDPVCGDGGHVQYFSPCHAGCQSSENIDGTELFFDCACVTYREENTSTEVSLDADAEAGICAADCQWLAPFLVFYFLQIMCISIAYTSGMAATLRCVSDKDRPFGFGLQSAIVRFLGNVPLPIILGLVFDSSCLVWQESCDWVGSCWIYDTDNLSVGLTVTILVFGAVGGLSFILAIALHSPSPSEDQLLDVIKVEATQNKSIDDVTSVDDVTLETGGNTHTNLAFEGDTEMRQLPESETTKL